MNQKDGEKIIDLLVIFTRLGADRNGNEDEFNSEWSPSNNSAWATEEIRDDEGLAGFWAKSEECNEGLLVIHGYKELLGKKPGSFQTVLLKNLKNSFSKSKYNIIIFAHGIIPETEYDLSSRNLPKLADCEGDGYHVQRLCGYTLSKRTAALAVPEALRQEKISNTLVGMVENCLRLKPAVERAVRSMQEIIAGLRFWCELYFEKESKIAKQTEGDPDVVCKLIDERGFIYKEIKACIDRLKDDTHWGNRAMTKTSKSSKTFDDILSIKNNLSKINQQQVNDRLRELSASLELLIADAEEIDNKRNKKVSHKRAK